MEQSVEHSCAKRGRQSSARTSAPAGLRSPIPLRCSPAGPLCFTGWKFPTGRTDRSSHYPNKTQCGEFSMREMTRFQPALTPGLKSAGPTGCLKLLPTRSKATGTTTSPLQSLSLDGCGKPKGNVCNIGPVPATSFTAITWTRESLQRAMETITLVAI